MQTYKQERENLLWLINEYCSKIDNRGLWCVVEMARCCWREAQRQEAAAEAAEAVAAAGKIIPFPRR